MALKRSTHQKEESLRRSKEPKEATLLVPEIIYHEFKQFLTTRPVEVNLASHLTGQGAEKITTPRQAPHLGGIWEGRKEY